MSARSLRRRRPLATGLPGTGLTTTVSADAVSASSSRDAPRSRRRDTNARKRVMDPPGADRATSGASGVLPGRGVTGAPGSSIEEYREAPAPEGVGRGHGEV